ncbi:hypothetical protein L4D76_18420 [Photobacterium sagamiensis]|uniref:hypothetical protein n=1 Tax=Photobacterium sagamiensis TaxID=2910241 RepID=UPI003D10C3C4
MKTYGMAIITTTLLVGGGFSQASVANDTDQWHYEVTPYLLAAGMEGTVGVKDHTADVDASFSDIVDNLNMGFMGIFTAKKGPWTFALEGVYMKLDDSGASSVTGPGGFVSRKGELDVTNSMYIAQGTVGYRLVDGKTKLNGHGGLRYTKLEVDMDIVIQFDEPQPFGGAASEEGSENWVDAVVGLHVMHPVSDMVTLTGYVDIGGGGSDLTYQVMAGVNWEFHKGYTAKLGYRYLYWDYEDDGFVWDMAAKGPYLGLGIRF